MNDASLTNNSNIVISEISTTPSPHPDTFIRICLLWAALHRTTAVPSACKGVLNENHLAALQSRQEFGKLLNSLESSGNGSPYLKTDLEDMDMGTRHRDNHIKYQFRYTSRSLSVIGVLGGIVLILLLVAMSTCIKGRRNVLLEAQANSGHESFARQILIDHIRHISSSRRRNGANTGANDRPPSYDDVVKTANQDENDLGASQSTSTIYDDDSELPSYVEAMETNELNEASARDENSQSHVVTIEMSGDQGVSCSTVSKQK